MRGDIHLDTLLRVIGICTHVHCILLTRVMHMFARALHIACTCICLHVHCILLTRVMYMFTRGLHNAYTCNVLCYYCL